LAIYKKSDPDPDKNRPDPQQCYPLILYLCMSAYFLNNDVNYTVAVLGQALRDAGGRNCFVNQENLSRDKVCKQYFYKLIFFQKLILPIWSLILESI
jgi:hypothetical protein